MGMHNRTRTLLFQCFCVSYLTIFVVSTGSDLTALTEVTCYDEQITLDIREARVTIDGEISYTTRVYHLNDTPLLPGPVIRMKAGTQCSLTVTNSLSTTSDQATCNYHVNDYHCPDTTNLHTHGLHVSPWEDDIDVDIIPGDSHEYVYNMPSDHLMGTHWFHAHYHGSTSLQVIGGLVGALIVDPAADYTLPDDMQAAYDNAVIMLVTHVHFAGNDDVTRGVATSEAFYFLDYQGYSDAFGTDQTIDPAVEVLGSVSEFFAVNGQHQPVVDVTAGSVTVMRLVHASGIRASAFYISDDPNGLCTFTLLARDGVFHYTPYQTVEAIVMVQGTRADVAVVCTTEAAGQSFTVASGTVAGVSDSLGTQNMAEQTVVWTLRVSAPADGAVDVPAPTSAVTLPSYLNTLLSSTVALDAHTLILAAGEGSETVNDRPFQGFHAPDDDDAESGLYEMKLCLEDVYEISLEGPPPPGGGGPPRNRRHLLQGGDTGQHPYHQHINHFQIVSPGGDSSSNGLVMRTGEWRDVAPILATTPTLIRFRPVEYSGQMVLHCHLLQHEDHGMMGLYLLQNGTQATGCVPCAGPGCEGTPDSDDGGDGEGDDAGAGGGDDAGDDSLSGAGFHGPTVLPLLVVLFASTLSTLFKNIA